MHFVILSIERNFPIPTAQHIAQFEVLPPDQYRPRCYHLSLDFVFKCNRNKLHIPALKPRGDVTIIPKQGYQWPQKWTCVHNYFVKKASYSKIVSLSALKAWNAMKWPGGAAISLYVLASVLTYAVYLGLWNVNVHWCRNSDRLLTIFSFGMRRIKSFLYSYMRVVFRFYLKSILKKRPD